MHDPLMLAQIRSAVGLVDFVSKTVELKPQGDDFFGLCPFHQENTPSFSITPENGLFYCHGCRAGGDIFSFVRQKHRVGFSDAVKILAIEAGIELDSAPQSAEYIYLNADSQNHLRVKRYYKKDGKKTFAQSRWDGTRWVTGSKSIERILYRLPEILTSDYVLIVEGEKDCHTARDFGLEAQLGAIATTSPGGATKWVLGAGERWLKDKRVVIIPDRDEAGDLHCRQVLGDVPWARVLKLPHGKDLTEYIEGGGTVEELVGLIEGVLSASDRNGLEQGILMSDRNGHEESGALTPEMEFGITSDTTTIESLEDEIIKLKEDLVNATPRSPESTKINREIDAKSHKLKTLKRQTKPLEKKVNTTQVGPLVEDYLYSDKKWICYLDELYFWTGNYYKKSPDEAERPKITSFLNALSVPVQNDDGSFSENYPFRETKHVIEALKWVKFRNEITQEMLNPPGFNCKNGVIECHWNGENFNAYEFVPHDPLIHFYLTPPNIDYNPNADPWHYNKLMECLEPEYRTIWERTIASALDLKNIRIIKGSRTVRALLLKGDGSNGKDTLKFLVQQLFGYGKVSSCSLADFKQYDEGNRFSLYALQNKAINWPSENVGAIAIENLQSLKSAITGDTVYFEAKGRNAIEGNPQTVFMFNINKSVDLMTQLTALESRWAIIPFNKTYSDNPKGDHELQADPRFKEDDHFVREQVAPAFLNRLLKQLQDLAIEGIDFSPTKKLMTEMQQQTCHLLQFCADVGIEYKADYCVFVEDIWKRLYTWYEDNAYLEIGDYGKKTWTTSRNGDQLIKSSNQVSKRFLELFPKATPDKRIKPTDINRNNKTVIKGITMKDFEYRAQ